MDLVKRKKKQKGHIPNKGKRVKENQRKKEIR